MKTLVTVEFIKEFFVYLFLATVNFGVIFQIVAVALAVVMIVSHESRIMTHDNPSKCHG